MYRGRKCLGDGVIDNIFNLNYWKGGRNNQEHS